MQFMNKIQSLYQLQELLNNDKDEELINMIKTDPKTTIRNLSSDPNADDLSKYKIDSLTELEEKLDELPYLADIIRKDPKGFVHYLAKETQLPEYALYKIVVSSLCGVLIIIIAGVLAAWFTKNSREAPTLVTAVACTALGLLAGIFVRVPGRYPRKTGRAPLH